MRLPSLGFPGVLACRMLLCAMRLSAMLWCAMPLCARWAGAAPADAARAGESLPRFVRNLDAATVGSILALDCTRLTAADVAGPLAQAPAPRIILLQGSLAVMTMEPFGEFLVAMGYPVAQVRDPRDGRMSHSSFGDSLHWAGALAWYYESDGVMPMLIGHSQGGMMAIRILYELDGAFHQSIPVWNPLIEAELDRAAIRDPVSGETRPVKGLAVGYAAAIATGKLPRILLGQWDMIAKLRRIPDTADEFTGFSIPWDPIAGTFADPEPYVATGTARVRNVTLPAGTSHIMLPRTSELAANEVTRAWIEGWSPSSAAAVPDDGGIDVSNIVHAADIWYSVKRNWCVSAQRLLLAKARR
jgi:hypothetical protein